MEALAALELFRWLLVLEFLEFERTMFVFALIIDFALIKTSETLPTEAEGNALSCMERFAEDLRPPSLFLMLIAASITGSLVAEIDNTDLPLDLVLIFLLELIPPESYFPCSLFFSVTT